MGSDNLSNLIAIADRIAVIEAQLEGLFRRAFQACQQNQFAGYLDQNLQICKKINNLTEELSDLVQEHIFLKKREDDETISKQKELN